MICKHTYFNPKLELNLNLNLEYNTGQDAILRWRARGQIKKQEEGASLLAGCIVIDTCYGSARKNMGKTGAVS
jgi:hypothetical protein